MGWEHIDTLKEIILSLAKECVGEKVSGEVGGKEIGNNSKKN